MARSTLPPTVFTSDPITHFSKWALVVVKSAITGSVPAASGYGLIVYGGGTLENLIVATGCPRATMALWVTARDGAFVPYVPGTVVGAVNAPFLAMFDGGKDIPASTPLIGKCR